MCCLPLLHYRSCLVTLHKCRRSGSLRAGALPLPGSDIGHLVFLLVPHSLIAEAAESVAYASAAALSSASNVWSMVAPAANRAASLPPRPKVATMLACTTYGGVGPELFCCHPLPGSFLCCQLSLCFLSHPLLQYQCELFLRGG